jgi:uncharacterized OsmC-like protein
MKTETIRETMRLWEEQPDKAKGTPTVKARADGAQGLMEAGPFSWRADLPQPLGGTNQAPSPTALLLSALAGCAVVFIRDTLAPQFGVRIDAIDATALCQTDARGLLGMGAAPDLQNLRLDIRIQSPDGEENVQRLLQVWRERCPIYLALLNATAVDVTMQVTQEQPA